MTTSPSTWLLPATALHHLLLLPLVLLQASPCGASMPPVITIGAVLSSPATEDLFHQAVDALNRATPGLLPSGVSLNATSIPMNDNPIVAAQAMCSDLIPKGIYVAIASHPQHSDLSPLAVSFTCGFYKIPVLGISARDSTFSDKKVHTAFMRTAPPYSEQSEVWVHLMRTLEFKRVVFIHSSDQEGRAMLSRFQSQAEAKDIEIEKSVPYTAGLHNFTDALTVLQSLSSRVILLYARADDAAKIYADAVRLNVIGAGYAWFVTEQAMEPANTPPGVLGLKLENVDEGAHIKDALRVIAMALSAMETAGVNITEAPMECDDGSVPWQSGTDILHYMRAQHFDDGETGVVQFDSSGDRMKSEYQVVNVRQDKLNVVGSVGGKDGKFMFEKDRILWPGNQTQKPKGVKISTRLKVVTIVELPFVYAEPMPVGECVKSQRPGENKIPCPRHNYTEGTKEDFCCSGYCIDLLVMLANKVNFTYDLHLVGDGQYGSFERRNGSNKKTWNGMVAELEAGQADMIVAPLTINPERAEYVDFSKPFKYQGLTILVKKTTKDSSLASFLQPFQDTLWILVGLSVHVVALVLYLLDRFSPFGRFKLAKSDDTEEDALNLSSAMWFAWGVLLNSGIGEGTPRSFSARVLGMVWAGFAMIIVASYTANLAAFLVLDRPEASISGIDDARLRNPQENFKYATVQHSAVAMYFKRQVELSTMYRTMESRNYKTAEEAIQDVRTGSLHAFIWDSSRLEYEAASDCDLVTPGQLFGRSGYGIGLNKNSPWTEDVSLAILNFHEGGEMERLDGKWILIKYTKCPEKDTSPATLGLTNMAGVFMMVAGGIVTGIFLIFIEIAYKKHRGLKEKELELAKTAADRWRGNIEKRRTLRHTLQQQRQEANQVTNGTTGSPSLQRLPLYSSAQPPPAGYQPVATNIKCRHQMTV